MKTLNIFGIDYDVVYCDNPADVDLYKRKSLHGQVDTWTRTIRIYAKDKKEADLFESLERLFNFNITSLSRSIDVLSLSI